MKIKFVITLVFCGYISIAQNNIANNHDEVDNIRFTKYLDCVRNIFQSEYSEKRAETTLINFLFDDFKVKSSPPIKNQFYINKFDGTNYIKTSEGIYKHVITNKLPYNIFGIKGIGKQTFIISSYSSDFYEQNSIISIDLFFELYTKDYTEERVIELKNEIYKLFVEYYRGRCVYSTETSEYENVRRGRGWTFNSVSRFHLFSKKYINNLNDLGLEDCAISDNDSKLRYGVDIGFCNNVTEMTRDYYSYVFNISIKNIWTESIFELKNEMKEVLCFIRVDYNDEDYEKFDMREINTYDLRAMTNFFLLDCKAGYGINNIKHQNIKATFETLEENVLALSYGKDDDSSIIIKVDPENWANANIITRWYVLYHELGHDVLNFSHGEGGKMMFNFANKEYKWENFCEDKEYMMQAYRSKK